MNNALMYLGGFFVVVFAALFAVPAAIDWNGYRGVFEEEASKVLGRDVRVGGKVNLRLLPSPYVRFEKVRLADVSGQTGEPFIRAESFTMWLSASPLLRGVLEANKIELDRPVLTLALDGQGGGNWNSIALQPGALPFVPRDVTLHSVKLIDGSVALHNADASLITRFDSINGELSADGLTGPFRLKGTAAWNGEVRDIRLGTEARDKDGSFKVKASAQSIKSGNSILIDGRVENFSTQPRLTGEVTGTIAVPGVEKETDAAAPKAEAPILEYRSALIASATEAKLEDIKLTLANAKEPQTVTGSATASWSKDARLDIALASKWLDLDRLAGAGENSASFKRIRRLALGLIKSVTGTGTASAKIDLAQVKIGGETAGGLRIDAERRDGAIRIKDLRVGLPGASRLALSGVVKDESGEPSLNGQGFLSGSNLARLRSWAEKSGSKIDIGYDGAFTAEGRVRLNAKRFELTEASAEIGGQTITGELRIIDDVRHRAEITLETAQLSSSDLFPATIASLEASVRRAVGLSQIEQPGEPASEVPQSDTIDGEKSETDISLRVLARELKHGDATFRDVDATLAMEAGEIRIPSTKFTTSGGLNVAVEGRILNTANAPKGSLAFDIAGDTARSTKDLVTLLNLQALVAPERAEKFGQSKLAGLIQLGRRGSATTDINVSGSIGSTNIDASGEFDKGFANWRVAPVRLNMALMGQDLQSVIAMFGAALPPGSASDARPASIRLTTAGILESQSATLLEVKADGLNLGYDGSLAWPATGTIGADGKLTIAAVDLREVVALAGLAVPPGVSKTAVDGNIDIARSEGAWKLNTRAFALGGATLKGTASIEKSDDAIAKIDADITVNHMSIAGLLAGLLDKPFDGLTVQTMTDDAVPDDALPKSIWPDGVFNFAALANVQGNINVRFDRLLVTDAMAAGPGTLTLVMQPDKVVLKDLVAKAGGGDLSGNIALEKASGGTAFETRLRIEGLDLANLSKSATGRAGFEMTATARAQSPSALIGAMTGSGQIRLDNAQIPGPSIAAVRSVADSVLLGTTPNEPEPVQQALATAIAGSIVDLGTRTAALTIGEGSAKIEAMGLENAQGQLNVITSIDLLALGIDSVWKVAPTLSPVALQGEAPAGWSPSRSKGPLPNVAVEYRGRLDDIANLTTAIGIGDMQRELTVRQMEFNVEELERLRKLDEQRARQEVERRNALEEQRAAEKAARSGAKAGPTVEAAPSPESAPPNPNGAPDVPDGQVPSETETPPSVGTGANVSPESADPTIVSVPQTDAAIDSKSQSAPRNYNPPRARRAEPRRTTTEEIMKSIGGVP